MADISKIKCGSTSYTIKDATARTSISTLQCNMSPANSNISRSLNRRF